MAGATISFSPMERRWFVWPGGGKPTLAFTDEAAARAAKATIDAGKSMPAASRAAGKTDPSDFLPSRSSKESGCLEPHEPPLQIGRPMPKHPGRAARRAVERRATGRVTFDVAEAARAYAKNGSLHKTAKQFGVAFETLRRHFHKAGVAINAPSRWGARA